MIIDSALSKVTMAGVVLALVVLIWQPAWPEEAAPDPAAGLLDRAKASLAQGQASQALFEADQAARAIWARTPFRITTCLMTEGQAEGFGIYRPVREAVFRPSDDPVHIYLETEGYAVETDERGMYNFGLAVDMILRNKAGNVLGRENGFLVRRVKSHRFNREFFVTVVLNLNNIPPGEYTIGLRVRDLVGQAHDIVELPVRFKP